MKTKCILQLHPDWKFQQVVEEIMSIYSLEDCLKHLHDCENDGLFFVDWQQSLILKYCIFYSAIMTYLKPGVIQVSKNKVSFNPCRDFKISMQDDGEDFDLICSWNEYLGSLVTQLWDIIDAWKKSGETTTDPKLYVIASEMSIFISYMLEDCHGCKEWFDEGQEWIEKFMNVQRLK